MGGALAVLYGTLIFAMQFLFYFKITKFGRQILSLRINGNRELLG